MKTIQQQNYFSFDDFVQINELEAEAIELFGKDYEQEDDIEMIKELLHSIGKKNYNVDYIEGLQSDYDIAVYYNKDKALIEKQKDCAKNVLDLLYKLKDKFEYDETETSEEIGEMIDQVQKVFFKQP